MPELPEVEVLSRELKNKILGCVIEAILVPENSWLVSSRKIFESKLKGRKILGVARRGKFLSFHCDGHLLLWFHLGMTGQLLWSPAPQPEDRHIHFGIKFRELSEPLIFRDVRKFGKVFLTNGSSNPLPDSVALLGFDPFQISEKDFINIFGKRKGRIKSLLLNQRLLAGLGNIYADESLFGAGIDPRKRPLWINRKGLAHLYRAVRKTLLDAIEHGGSSVDDYLHVDGSRGRYQDFHHVYGRKGASCHRCGSLIRRVVVAGRGTHFCPECQK